MIAEIMVKLPANVPANAYRLRDSYKIIKFLISKKYDFIIYCYDGIGSQIKDWNRFRLNQINQKSNQN